MPKDRENAARRFMPSRRNVLKGLGAVVAGLKVRRINEESEELFTSEEVFPEGSPAMALRGLRGKEDITQAKLAKRLGISQNMVSDMESGKRNISLKMAKRISEEFKISYRVFL
jgi:DNA-binding XRE family transcriptional regulator